MYTGKYNKKPMKIRPAQHTLLIDNYHLSAFIQAVIGIYKIYKKV
jgi:hypothetical protein